MPTSAIVRFFFFSVKLNVNLVDPLKWTNWGRKEEKPKDVSRYLFLTLVPRPDTREAERE